jgi:SAM-dependent methyltransferase
MIDSLLLEVTGDDIHGCNIHCFIISRSISAPLLKAACCTKYPSPSKRPTTITPCSVLVNLSPVNLPERPADVFSLIACPCHPCLCPLAQILALPLGITVGVESAHAMASLARQRGIKVYEARVEELPFADESFDFVVMVTTICFLGDPVKALQETRRVLKPRGRIIVGMIDADSPLGKTYEAKKSGSTFYRYVRFYSVMKVTEWLTPLGFGAITTMLLGVTLLGGTLNKWMKRTSFQHAKELNIND